MPYQLTKADRERMAALEAREGWKPAMAAPADSAAAPAAVVQGDGAVTPPGLPVSRSLPRRKIRNEKGELQGVIGNRFGHQVVEFPDGGITNLRGQPIIDGNRSAEREMGRHGWERTDQRAKE